MAEKKPNTGKHKIGDIVELPTGKRKLTMVNGRPKWVSISEPGGEKKRSSSKTTKGIKKSSLKKSDLSDIDPGAVLQFSYSGPKAHDPKPTILFLSLWKNVVHGINIKYLTTAQINALWTIIKHTHPNIEKPKQFYDNYLKAIIQKMRESKNISAYRTYNVSRISNIKLISINLRELPTVKG